MNESFRRVSSQLSNSRSEALPLDVIGEGPVDDWKKRVVIDDVQGIKFT
jgi:hypothetical protein